MMWLLLWGPLALLAGLALVCAVRLPKERRRGLLPAVLTVGSLSAVLFLGEWLLNRNDLTWRIAPKTALSVILWLAGLTAGILTVRYVMRWLERDRPKLALWGAALALYCLISTMGAGTLLGGLWAMGPEEQVGTWQGQTVVQGKWTWMDTSYDVYAYHGLLVRGKEPLAWDEDPMLEE